MSPAAFRNLAEVAAAAAARWPPEIRDYVEGGAAEERTLRANLAAFRVRTLLPRALSGVRSVDLRTELLGAPSRLPVFAAPTAYQGSIHPDGEVATARGAAERGVVAGFSTLSTRSLEEIAAAAPTATRWFQLYLQPDPAEDRRLVQRAEAAGFRAMVLTVDVPLLANRDRQARGGFALDAPAAIGNGPGVVSPARAPEEGPDGYSFRADAGATWDTFEQLVRGSSRPWVVKGILTPADARRALDRGAQGIVVSNHGGRQLDGAPATLDVLGPIVAEVGDQAEVFLDGGVRRGTDVVIARALGARAVGLGRPVLWALGAGGADGVARYFELLGLEIASTMALIGRRSLAELTPEIVGRSPYPSVD